jgi:hypothetical protein
MFPEWRGNQDTGHIKRIMLPRWRGNQDTVKIKWFKRRIKKKLPLEKQFSTQIVVGV